MCKKLFLLLAIAATVASCWNKNNRSREERNYAVKEELKETDRAFSKMSQEKGLHLAYMEFIDSAGVLLRPNQPPLEEGNVMDFISSNDDSGFVMTWEPMKAAVSSSGDLGYTYGVFSYRQDDDDIVRYGTYVTVWKKQPGGKWKFVLHSGNEGLKPPSAPEEKDPPKEEL